MRLDDFSNLAVSTASRIGWLVSSHRFSQISQLLLVEREENTNGAIFLWVLEEVADQRLNLCLQQARVLKIKWTSYSIRLPTGAHMFSAHPENKYSNCFCTWLQLPRDNKCWTRWKWPLLWTAVSVPSLDGLTAGEGLTVVTLRIPK